MKIAFVLLMVISGLSVSVILIGDSAKKVRTARTLYEVSSFIEERIRIAATPIQDIIEQFNETGKKCEAVTLSFLTKNDDPEIRRLSEGICRLDMSGALTMASFLKNYTERKWQRISDEASRSRKIMIVLPPAALLLISLLLI